jgi:hypothetical protein
MVLPFALGMLAFDEARKVSVRTAGDYAGHNPD